MTTIETNPAADQAAIAELPRRVMAAWGAHDADAFAEVFTDDATMIIAGVHRKGRAAIRTYMAAAFEGPYRGTQVVGTPVDLRVLGPDVALLLSEGGVRGKTAAEVADADAVRASWLVTRQDDGRWLLAAYQNTPRD